MTGRIFSRFHSACTIKLPLLTGKTTVTKTAPLSQQAYLEKCKTAASKGNVIAQNTLGFLYLNGQSVTQDYQLAAKWFRHAADNHYAPAQFNLAIMYKLGQGVEQNHSESIKWMQLAANQDYAEAQSHLGNMYYQGLAVMQDYQMAYMWWSLAEQNGVEDLQHIKAVLLEKMTESEIDQAEQSIKQWQKKQ